MRIIVLSDTHRQRMGFIGEMIELEKPGLVLHLGDNVEDGEDIFRSFGIKTLIVRGNGDLDFDYPYDRIVNIEGKRIFMTHGHKYNVKKDFMNLYNKGVDVEADIVLYGHTHVPVNTEENGIIIMNPGSPSMPRQRQRIKTIGLIEINERIETKIIELI